MILNSYSQIFNMIYQISEGGSGVASFNELKTLFCDMTYPIGSYFITTSSNNPSIYFPNTEWEQLAEDSLLKTSADSQGGVTEVTLTNSNYTSHEHTGSGNTVSGQGSHRNWIYARSSNGGTANQIESYGGNHLSTYTAEYLNSGQHTHGVSTSSIVATGEQNPVLNIMPKGYGVYVWKRIS